MKIEKTKLEMVLDARERAARIREFREITIAKRKDQNKNLKKMIDFCTV
jgi:hypothetical protein